MINEVGFSSVYGGYFSAQLKIPVHQLSRRARDRPISDIYADRPANEEVQNIN